MLNNRLESKAKGIFRATKQHAQNLGMFATIYKTLMIVQKHFNGGKEANIHPFIAGVIGGYYVFGENNSINQQVGSIQPAKIKRPLELTFMRVTLIDYSLSLFSSCIGNGQSTCKETNYRCTPTHLSRFCCHCMGCCHGNHKRIIDKKKID